MSIVIRANSAELEQQNNGLRVAFSGKNEQKSEQAGRKTIFAGNLGLNGAKSQIEMKREYARKQAMKVIGDAFGRDKQVSDDISSLRQEKEELLAEIRQKQSRVSASAEVKENLRQEYGVEADSDEQKDLELLEKYQNYTYGVGSAVFSEEEIDRLKELQNEPLTEYQKRVLNENGAVAIVRQELDMDEQRLKFLAASIEDAKVEQLKSQDMLKAEDTAGEIIDAAESEILGLLYAEGKDHIDEEQQEREEKAEEAQEKKEELEERIEKAKDQKEELEEHIEEAKDQSEEQEALLRGENKVDQVVQDIKIDTQGDSRVQEAQKRIQKILEENNLINEDLKGIKIDFNF